MTAAPGRLATGTPTPVAEILAWSRGVVTPALRAAIDPLPEPLRHIAGYHLGWWDADGRPEAASGGKAVRSAFALLSGAAVSEVVSDAVPAAVAVELVHNFSLLHDDVMDRDVTRRHRPTAWTVFGESPAVLAGDSLLAAALLVIAGTNAAGAAGRLAGAVQELLAGQYADLDFESRSDVDLAAVEAMAEGKTAALFGAACALGALCAGAGGATVDALTVFGRRAGLAFQIVDDLLGIWGDPALTGKPAHTDLRSRKKSFPVVAALRSATPAGDELAALYGRSTPLGEPELVRAAALVEAAGARRRCEESADRLLAEARAALGGAGVADGAAERLWTLARFLGGRDH